MKDVVGKKDTLVNKEEKEKIKQIKEAFHI